jgi:predicted protein tyrosine phosphatase
MKLTLLKSDHDIIEDFEEIEDLKARCFQSKVSELNLMTVKTNNIAAIVSRPELFSIIFLSDKKDLSNYNVISITEPFQDKSDKGLDINCNALLQLEFTDIRKEVSEEFLETHKSEISMISTEQIEIIKSFIKNNSQKPFIINCDAGISRSAAIGIVLEKLIGNKEGVELIENFKRYSPNRILLKKFK